MYSNNFGPKNIDIMALLTLANVELQRVSNIKYLGICIAAEKVFKTDYTGYAQDSFFCC